MLSRRSAFNKFIAYAIMLPRWKEPYTNHSPFQFRKTLSIHDNVSVKIKNGSEKAIIMSAFTWDRTQEGGNYWSKLHEKMFEYLEKIENQ